MLPPVLPIFARLAQVARRAAPQITKANAKQAYNIVYKYAGTAGTTITVAGLVANNLKDAKYVHEDGMNPGHYAFSALKDAGAAALGHLYGGAIGAVAGYHSGLADIARKRAGYLKPGEEKLSDLGYFKEIGLHTLKTGASLHPISGAAVGAYDLYQTAKELTADPKPGATPDQKPGFTSAEVRQMGNAMDAIPANKSLIEPIVEAYRATHTYVTNMGTALTAAEHENRILGKFTGYEI